MIYLGIFIIAVCILSYFRKKQTKKQEAVEDAFWQREYQANHSPRQDISRLPYITISLEKFPIGICENEELKKDEEILRSLSDKKILNLGSQTNTDLKMKYGVSNLSTLMECDENFALLCRTLVSYAETLIRLNRSADAKTVLEFGVSCGSDYVQNYLLLAGLYLDAGNTECMERLIADASQLDSPQKTSILQQLSKLRQG